MIYNWYIHNITTSGIRHTIRYWYIGWTIHHLHILYYSHLVTYYYT